MVTQQNQLQAALVSDLETLALGPTPCSEVTAEKFLSLYTLEAIFGLFGSHFSDEVEASICSGLEKLFQSKLGAELLSQVSGFLAQGLDASSHRVRKLACRLLGVLLQGPSSNSPADSNSPSSGATTPTSAILQVHNVVEPPDSSTSSSSSSSSHLPVPALLASLTGCLADPETGVADAAATALLSILTSHSLGLNSQQCDLLLAEDQPRGCGPTLKRLAESQDAVVWMRVVSLGAIISASACPEVVRAVEKLQLLSCLEKQLADPKDLLACMAGLEMLADAASYSPPGVPSGSTPGGLLSLSPSLRCHLFNLLRPSTDSILRCKAMTALGRLISQEDGGFPEEFMHTLCAILSDAPEEDSSPVEVSVSALESLYLVGYHSRSRELASAALARPQLTAALLDKALAGATLEEAVQVAALHALGALAGSAVTETTHGLLSPQAEGEFKSAMYLKLTSLGLSLGEVCHRLVSQSPSFSPRLTAALSLISSLVVRPWGAAEITAHANLLDLILCSDARLPRESRQVIVTNLALTVERCCSENMADSSPANSNGQSLHLGSLFAMKDRILDVASQLSNGRGMQASTPRVATMQS